MSFEWDQNKAAVNLDKHDIDFADAATVFDDSNAVTIDDPISGFKTSPQAQFCVGPRDSILDILNIFLRLNPSLRLDFEPD
jgi:uncharacterized DUF497 family protein